MRRSFSLFLILGLVIIVGILAYLLGRKANVPAKETFISNTTFVKHIAELSSLEVQGTATLNRTNLQNDGSFSDAMRRMFLENTVHLTVPYIAKYGVNLQEQNISINEKDSLVTILLPQPKLLSYELRLDKADANTKKGLLQSSSDQEYTDVDKSLYTKTRQQMENNPTYIKQSQDKISQILREYYTPFHYKVNVVFDQNLNNTNQ